MHAVILNCSLKPSPAESNSEALATVVAKELSEFDVTHEIIRLADHNIKPGVSSDEGEGDDWPAIRQKIISSEILIITSPTWVGTLTSFAMRALERMDALLSETDDQDRPIAYNRVGAVVSVGNEDGAKHVIGEIEAALIELGFTVPGQSWTYFNHGAAMGEDYLKSDNKGAFDRAHKNAKLASHNIYHVARALQESPIPKP